MTDAEIVKALEICSTYKASCKDCPAFVKVGRSNCEKYFRGALDLINRQKADLEKFTKRQKPTGASGYKIENGKVVFFTNILGGYREEKENLEEVVKTLNELLHEAYSKDEIAFALKCKTEELKTANADIEKLREDNETLRTVVAKSFVIRAEGKSPLTILKAEAYKEFAEEYKDQIKNYTGMFTDYGFMVQLEAVLSAVDFIKNKLVGDNDAN